MTSPAMATAAVRLLIGIRKALTVIYSRVGLAADGITTAYTVQGTFVEAQNALRVALNLPPGIARDNAVFLAMTTMTTITEQRIILEKALPVAKAAVDSERLAAAGYSSQSVLSRSMALSILDGLEAGKTYEEVALLHGLDLNTARFLTSDAYAAFRLTLEGATERATIASMIDWATVSATVTVVLSGPAAGADLTTLDVVTNGLQTLRDTMRAFFNLVLLGDIGPTAGLQIDAWVRQLYEQTTLSPLPSVRLFTGRGSRSTGELDLQMINTGPTILLRVSCEAPSVGSLKFRNALGGLVVLTIGPGLGPKGEIYNRSFPNGILVEQTDTSDRFLIQWNYAGVSLQGSSDTSSRVNPDNQNIAVLA